MKYWDVLHLNIICKDIKEGEITLLDKMIKDGVSRKIYYSSIYEINDIYYEKIKLNEILNNFDENSYILLDFNSLIVSPYYLKNLYKIKNLIILSNSPLYLSKINFYYIHNNPIFKKNNVIKTLKKCRYKYRKIYLSNNFINKTSENKFEKNNDNFLDSLEYKLENQNVIKNTYSIYDDIFF